jgi:hypothetical protein
VFSLLGILLLHLKHACCNTSQVCKWESIASSPSISMLKACQPSSYCCYAKGICHMLWMILFRVLVIVIVIQQSAKVYHNLHKPLDCDCYLVCSSRHSALCSHADNAERALVGMVIIEQQQQHMLYLPQLIACKLECPKTSPQCSKAFSLSSDVSEFRFQV